MAAVVVMLVFLFLQYNRVLFAAVDAYVRPGNMDSSILIVDPNASTTVSGDPRLIIPTISVDVPIIWTADASSQDSLNAAMDNGVAWFNIQGASAGRVKKATLSSRDIHRTTGSDKGDYKFIFCAT